MAIQPRRRRPVSTRLFPFVLFGFFVLAGVIVFTMVNGELRIPFLSGNPAFAFSKEEARSTGAVSGTVPVLVNPRPLPAYTRISRGHLLADETTLSTVNVPAETAEKNKLFVASAESIAKIRGRVLAYDKAAPFAFSEDDFLPKGTRSGLSAGIPAGKRGLWVDAQKVFGLADVQRGDRFDLLGSPNHPIP